MDRRTRTTLAAGVALVAMASASTVVEAHDVRTTPEPTTEAGGAPGTAPTTTAPATTMTIVVPVDESATQAQVAAGPATTVAAADAGEPTTTVTEPPPSASTPADASPTGTSTAPAATATASHVVDQQTVVQGTQVAVAVSGSNEIVSERSASGSGATGGADVSSGAADAIGSRDDNAITQVADVVLTGDAVARILQIALILNIGASVANSGANAVGAAPTGDGTTGEITTGDAGAIGNDIASYITQGASVQATNAVHDSTSQLAISMFLGLAIADSGMNSVVGTGVTGSGGGVATGDATAIGNDSITAITQRAVAVGTDGAQLDITQRATVLNLGFAVANSGLNQISGVAGQLLAASAEEDDALAADLFAMLLPALLDSYGYGVGSGLVASGDAAAVGNRSATYVEQVGRASATGDGTAVVDQEVLVANVGAAGANTGGNVLGSTARALDPQRAGAVVSMAAFLAQLLSMVHTSPDAAARLASSSQTLEVPFGDLVLQLEGSFDALDTSVGSGGSRADIRQISVVVSLGVAHADSGRNTTEVVSTTRVLAAVNALLPDLVRTGDATADNRAVVVICQRTNAADVACLAPPEETTPTEAAGQSPDGGGTTPEVAPPPTVAAIAAPARPGLAGAGGLGTSSAGRQLPATGSDPQTIVLLAAAFVLLGAGLLLVRRGAATAPMTANDPRRA